MKNKLEEILSGKVASVLCVKSRMYTSVNRSYQIFSALPILPYEPHSDAKIIGFPDPHLHYDYRFWSDQLVKYVFSDWMYETCNDWPARDLQGENLTLGRELKMRIFALAQGRQIMTWGLQGESDLLECFCSIFLGNFAVEECESYRNKYPKDS
jgi:hypothetical protein